MKAISKIIILSVLVTRLASCNDFVPRLTEIPTHTSTSLPTVTLTPPTGTLLPTSKPFEDIPISLYDIKEIAQIASSNTKSAEYQAMKYVLHEGIGTSTIYDDILGIRPYSGIFEYLDDNQLIFTPGDIPILTIDGVKGRHYEFWKSGRWYLVLGLLSFRDHETIEILTNIDSTQGSVISIYSLHSPPPLPSGKEFKYLVGIGVYRDQELYSAGLYLDERCELVEIDFGNVKKRLEKETIEIWLPRIQTEILPDFIETYFEK